MKLSTKVILGMWVAIIVGTAVMLNNSPTTDVKEEYYTVPNLIRITGKTDDGKYNTYDLEGDLQDLNYMSSDNTIYFPDDLPARLPFITLKDASNGEYACVFICKDKHGKIVGLNPAWASVYDKYLSK